MEETVVKEKVKDFLSQTIKNHELKDNDNFFQLGFVNSLFAMQLVNFVEGEFNFTVDSEDLEIKNFNTIAAITSLVMRKQSA